ncbi:MAG: isopentenyl-diphosphate Delta-isomerase [Putridiphycobacter sp.]
MTDQVVLVNHKDEVVGFENKLVAHQKGLMHRAISVLVFNEKGEWLLQKRAKDKYHSGGLWTNTCCSHPYPNESVENAAKRRLIEEMGLDVDVKFLYHFHYNIKVDNNLSENELDHVFIAKTNSAPQLNPDEASDFKYISTANLEKDIAENPENYTGWFKIIFNETKTKL